MKTILKKTSETYKDWHEKLPLALWGYRTSIRASTGATPFSLVYGMEAVLPIELEIPSLRVAMESQLTEVDWVKSRYKQLSLIDEKRLRAIYHVQGYQKRIARAFNKRVKDWGLKKGDLILKEIRMPIYDPRGKFKPSWVGPYIIKEILSGRVVRLIDVNGNEFSQPTNLDQLKKYHI